jgi:ribosomal protein L29
MAAKKKSSEKTVEVSKKMSFKELQSLSADDLNKKSTEIRKELVVLKKSTIEGVVQNYKISGQKRKELARTLTALNQKSKEEK